MVRTGVALGVVVGACNGAACGRSIGIIPAALSGDPGALFCVLGVVGLVLGFLVLSALLDLTVPRGRLELGDTELSITLKDGTTQTRPVSDVHSVDRSMEGLRLWFRDGTRVDVKTSRIQHTKQRIERALKERNASGEGEE